MTTSSPLDIPPEVLELQLNEKFMKYFNRKGLLNRLASKALEIADIILGSIPGASGIGEIKEVAESAIKK
jgi:hypothetical protein